MCMRSIHLQVPDDLLTNIDQARGDVSRNLWLRQAIEFRLTAGPPMVPRPPSPPAATRTPAAGSAQRPITHRFVGLGKHCGSCGFSREAHVG